jgi:NitT/TauT family transport system substrate-binding protein
VAFSQHLSWGPLMIAHAEGFFREEGLDVEFVTLLRPEESLVALVTGDIDVRPGPLSAGFLSAIARQAPVRIVAGMGNLSAGSCSTTDRVRPGIDTTERRRLRSARARTAPHGSSSHTLARRTSLLMDQMVRIPEAVMKTALETGALDAVAVSEPVLTKLRKFGTLWLNGQDAVPGFQWAIVAFGERLLVRERDTGMRFIRAYQRGVARYRLGKTDRNVAIIAEATHETAEHTREVCWLDFPPESSGESWRPSSPPFSSPGARW